MNHSNTPTWPVSPGSSDEALTLLRAGDWVEASLTVFVVDRTG